MQVNNCNNGMKKGANVNIFKT